MANSASSPAIFKQINGAAPSLPGRGIKISMIGVGNVAMAAVHVIVTKHLADELVLVGTNDAKVQGEMLDLQHAAAFLPKIKISAGVDHNITAGSNLCIVSAGARQKPYESRLDLVQNNVKIFKEIIPSLAKSSPDMILLIVSNPVDVLTHVAWKLSGLPPNRVIGSGTNLDSSRFQYLIANTLNMNPRDVQGFIAGEHGDSSVPLWSTVTVGGAQLSYMDSDEKERIHKTVIGSAYDVIRLKGYTSSAIGHSIADIAHSILRDQGKVHPVSILADGFYGVGGGVFLSLPAKVGRSGIMGVPNLELTDQELEKLKKSAETILQVQSQLDLDIKSE